MKKKRTKERWSKYVSSAFTLLLGVLFGFLMIRYFDLIKLEVGAMKAVIFFPLMIFGGILLATFLHIIIHEAGHLIFGLLTGYHFSTFRIGNFMLVKEDKRLKIKQLSLPLPLPVIVVQCSLTPPELFDEKTPYVLYTLGGSIANFVSALIFLTLSLHFTEVIYLSLFLLLLNNLGFVFAVVSGIPTKSDMESNDGNNTLTIAKDQKALYSFYSTLKIVDQTLRGISIKDMPEEWFSIPSVEEMENILSASLGTSVCNRLMYNHQFDRADQLMEQLLERDSLIELQQKMLICDRVYCELIGKNRKDVLDVMLDSTQKEFMNMKSMKKLPAILRTEYAYALIAENNSEKATKILEEFEKIARMYPDIYEIESECELINLIKK